MSGETAFNIVVWVPLGALIVSCAIGMEVLFVWATRSAWAEDERGAAVAFGAVGIAFNWLLIWSIVAMILDTEGFFTR